MEKQELYCHNCGKYVRFDVPETDGNLVIVCPNCKHEHCRVVKDGVITEDRWESRNGQSVPAMYATGTSSSTYSFVTTYGTSSTSSTWSSFTSQAWLDTTVTNT
jgi:hypothetical protein